MMFASVGARIRDDRLLLTLLLALGPLWWLQGDAWPESIARLPGLVHWQTIAALAGLMVLSRGLEDSGYLAAAGARTLLHLRHERSLAVALVLFSAALSAVVTNDVALFIVVPLTLSLAKTATLPVARLVVFEALAVNAGSTLSPIGNPQNLYLWQRSGAGFVEFTLALLPLGAGLVLLLLALVPLGFARRTITLTRGALLPARQRGLLLLSLALYPPFLIAADAGLAVPAAAATVCVYLVLWRRVVQGVDWMLLAVFILMFVDLGLLAGVPVVREFGESIELPGGLLSTGVLLSQVMSNVPAAIFLAEFSSDWRMLAWGVNVGGFGLAIGSLANLIALRLARRPGLAREFHLWSIPILAAAWLLALGLSWWLA